MKKVLELMLMQQETWNDEDLISEAMMNRFRDQPEEEELDLCDFGGDDLEVRRKEEIFRLMSEKVEAKSRLKKKKKKSNFGVEKRRKKIGFANLMKRRQRRRVLERQRSVSWIQSRSFFQHRL